ncbi:MAG: AAA family ATPase [Synechococcaceae cyanobacterium]|nr:AAA family ATPase [Synechococcaceae cyanobacterium]
MRPEAYDHPVRSVEIIETHISWILLTGSWAYKIRKPVHLGFVDFSTAARRRFCAEEELRLNRRLVADLYLDLVPVHGPPEAASLRGNGPVIDCAVRMRQFSQSDLLSCCLEEGRAPAAAAITQLADDLARFHTSAAVAGAGADPGWGEPELVRAPVRTNLEVLETCPLVRDRLKGLRQWSEEHYVELRPHLAARKAAGLVREGHGDLHLGNLVWWQGRITPFDCLEFNPSLRWIDVISDIAFLAMDLAQHRRPDLASLLLSRWLETGGDHLGLHTWRWYLSYRALVRAKVACLRLRQDGLSRSEQQRLETELDTYLRLAEDLSQQPRPLLLITHGLSGSGKSHWAQRIATRPGWIQLRSDVERLRLFGLWGLNLLHQTPLHGDRYAPAISEHLYSTLLPQKAAAVLAAGLSLVVDATFLRREERQRFAALASQAGAGFAILDCRCSKPEALARIEARRARGGDPSEADGAVLEQQCRWIEPLQEDEQRHAFVCNDHLNNGSPAASDGGLEDWLAARS